MNRPNIAEYTVSELSFALKRTVEDSFEHVRVRGEISGFKGAVGSGHCYFRLKDDKACLEAVIWRTTLQRLRFKPQEGLEMIATGKLTTFPGRSSYQIIVDSLEPAGEGALMAVLEDRRRKLQAEGLFDQARKKPIPYLPQVIGVVTSPTGAVIRDILHRLRDRFPSHVLLWPVRVQGDGAAEEVAAAVRGFNAISVTGTVHRPDVLIVARGGGSIEDLWAFNEEVAVRAVAESRIPVIAAVGHETDWTLIDHAADLRAPTPTGAAEMAVPVRIELLAATRELSSRHERALRRFMEAERRNYVTLCRALPSLSDLLALPRQKLDHSSTRLGRALGGNLERPSQRLGDISARLGRGLEAEVARNGHRFSALATRLEPALLARGHAQRSARLGEVYSRLARGHAGTFRQAGRDLGRTGGKLDAAALARVVRQHRDRYGQICRLFQTLHDTASPDAILAKGFALVLDSDGQAVRSPARVSPGDPLTIHLAEGWIAAVVRNGDSAATVPDSRLPTPRRAAKRALPRPKVAQGSLF